MTDLTVKSSHPGLIWKVYLGAASVVEGASLLTQQVKNPPARQETWVQSLSWDRLEQEMATHSNILAWEIPWTGVPGSIAESDMTEHRAHEWWRKAGGGAGEASETKGLSRELCKAASLLNRPRPVLFPISPQHLFSSPSFTSF